MKNKFITNNYELFDNNLYRNLEKCLNEAKSFIFSVAFINFAGVQIILDILKNCERKNIQGKILTTNYLYFTELKSVEFLKRFTNIEIKFFDSEKYGGFHTKGYIFEYEDCYKTIIGSSNLTKGGLKSNIEWNTLTTQYKDSSYIKDILMEFNFLWEKGVDSVPSYSHYTKYSPKVIPRKREDFPIDIYNSSKDREVADNSSEKITSLISQLEIKHNFIKPNYMQNIALEKLEKLRVYNENKALCISATGTGKTYLGAFDVRNFNAHRLLFVVHNEEILNSAIKTFKNVIPNKSYGKFTGVEKNYEADYIFATIQSMSKYFSEFSPKEFDYIIIDEAHHITANSYQKILEYFEPKFLLGLTATPERCDGGNIYEIFNMNVPVEIRLQEALDRNLVVPFHYYGIKDIDEVNLKDIKLSEIEKLTKALNLSKRVDFIIEKMNFYGHSGERRKALGFCVSIEQCEFMAKEFNKRGIKSISLTGNTNSNFRKNIIENFENDDVEIIFVVDIFNEGVDIPFINTILMLRPTNSPIIFTQQLGRGLRHYPEKEFLTIIDFIGNHNKTFLIALALMGRKGYDKESLKLAVKKDFENLSKNIHIKIDEICKEEIIAQLENENFNSFKYLQEEYKTFKDFLKRVPTPLDYINFDEAPELFRYILYSKSYAEFLEKVKDLNFKISTEEKEVLREIEKYLPIKRVYEFAIIHSLISEDKSFLDENEIFKTISKFIKIENIDFCRKNIQHSMRYLNQDFLDSQEIKKSPKLFSLNENKIFLTEYFLKILENKDIKNYILQILDFGLLRYKKEFQDKDYGFPFFKLYSSYTMKNVALLCNYENKHSAFRGSGIFTYGNDFFIFIELHKEANIKESINYKDKILTRESLQWQTQNATVQTSERGKNIIYNKERNINLHIFVRKFKEIDGITQPYIYLGKGDCIHFEGNKPITTKIKLQNILPKDIFNELTEKIENNFIIKNEKLEVAENEKNN